MWLRRQKSGATKWQECFKSVKGVRTTAIWLLKHWIQTPKSFHRHVFRVPRWQTSCCFYYTGEQLPRLSSGMIIFRKLCAPAHCVKLKSLLSSFHNNISEPHNWNANWWIKCLKGEKVEAWSKIRSPLRSEEGLHCLRKDRPDYPQAPGCHYVMEAFCELFKHTVRDTQTQRHITPNSR